MLDLADQFLAAWNSQEIERVLACYSPDFEYRDPNTRGPVRDADGMRRYLAKLFRHWRMHWMVREAQLFDNREGCMVLWRANFVRQDTGASMDVDGIDFVELRDGRISRNEVCFDRAQLAPLLQAA
jgi:ketosteroid isomerase-like protein